MKMFFMEQLRSLVLLCVAFCLCPILSASDIVSDTVSSSWQPRFTYSPYWGQLLGRNVENSSIDKKPYFGQEFLIGVQTGGDDPRHSALNFPYYGVGLYSGMYGDVMENIYAGFFFIDIPVVKFKKMSLNVAAAMGVALNCSRYTFDPDFLAHSSYVNVYSHLSLSYHYALTPNLDVGIGGRFQHFSNGSFQHPNFGNEMFSTQLSISYMPKMKSLEFSLPPLSDKKDEWISVLSVGINGSKTDFDKKYFYANTSLAYSFIKRKCYALGVGAEVTYNGSLEQELDQYSQMDLMYGGFFISNELIFQKVRFGFQFGTPVFNQVEFKAPYYERLVLRYQFIPEAFLHFGIKINADESECLEWGIGYIW